MALNGKNRKELRRLRDLRGNRQLALNEIQDFAKKVRIRKEIKDLEKKITEITTGRKLP